MRVLIVSGIYPPDIGGPATHCADLAAGLVERGHQVTVLAPIDDDAACDVYSAARQVRYPRSWGWPRRTLAFAAWIVRHRRTYDVVYANSMTTSTVFAARLARRPVVAKVVGDSAWERSLRLGWTDDSFDKFQQHRQTGRVGLMQGFRNAALRRATRVVAPSSTLAPLVARWSGGRSVTVIPNAVRVPTLSGSVTRPEGSARHVTWVGRMVDFKRVDLILDALANVEGLTLDLIGDGPERAAIESRIRTSALDSRVRVLGALGRAAVFEHLAAADALILASEYEMLPHTVIEALSVGTPVIAPEVGGIRELLGDGGTGLAAGIYTPTSVAALSELLRRFRDDAAFADALRSDAQERRTAWAFADAVSTIEAVLGDLSSRDKRADRIEVDGTGPRATLVFVGRSELAIDSAGFRRKLRMLSDAATVTILGIGPPFGRGNLEGCATVGARRPPGVVGNLCAHLAFYAWHAPRALVRASGRRPGAVVAQSPHHAFVPALLRPLIPRPLRPALVVETHGHWRAAPRLYGGRLRVLTAFAADAMARAAIRRADRVRTVSNDLTAAVRHAGFRGDVSKFMTFGDFAQFRDPPLAPLDTTPVAVFAGWLDPVKGVDVLLDAWSLVNERCPEARLVIAGDGAEHAVLHARAEALEIAGSVDFVGRVDRTQLASLIDGGRVFVLPSRSEGAPRVLIEAMARGRAVVATKVGGIPELVDDGRTGTLVTAEDPIALAAGLLQYLDDIDHARTVGIAAREYAISHDPERAFSAGMRDLAAWVATEAWRQPPAPAPVNDPIPDGEPASRPSVVFVTQIVDPDDPVLGVICNSMIELAKRSRLTVIANEVRCIPDALERHAVAIRSLGKERGASRLRRAIAYQRALRAAHRDGPTDAIVAHMCPIYAVAAAPFAKLTHAKTMLWYAHWRATPTLIAAEHACDVILTSLPGAYPRESVKVATIGQAIATKPYASIDAGPGAAGTDTLRCVAIGRTSPAKSFGLILAALARLDAAGHAVSLRIVGPSTTDEERMHRRELARAIVDLGASHWCRIDDPVSPREMPAVMAEADALINATAAGTGDKTVFEAMAAARIVITSNPAFTELLSDLPINALFNEGSADELEDRLYALRELDAATRATIGSELRRRVAAHHSADHWAEAVVTLVGTTGSSGAPSRVSVRAPVPPRA